MGLAYAKFMLSERVMHIEQPLEKYLQGVRYWITSTLSEIVIIFNLSLRNYTIYERELFNLLTIFQSTN